jgi:primase-polymerase (primpol)-like protein
MPTNNSFDNIPIELIELKQWVLWRLEEVIGAAKPTKIPYNGLGHKASVTNPDDWCSFSDALSIFHKGSYTGIGFVFTAFDPYAFIDLDATDDKENVARQLKIYKEFDSYSEKSPSGKGLHIIVKGAIPQGRKRSDVEIYSSGRYATMTGNIYNLKPIEERHDLLNQLFNQMGGIPKVYNSNNLNEPQNQTDEEIINQATNAVNGYKFNKLYNGEWEEFYPAISAAGQGSSDACFGLIDIISFYTQNRTQI